MGHIPFHPLLVRGNKRGCFLGATVHTSIRLHIYSKSSRDIKRRSRVMPQMIALQKTEVVVVSWGMNAGRFNHEVWGEEIRNGAVEG